VLDSHVMRFQSAVSWFSPGSYERRPSLGTPLKNLVCAGANRICLVKKIPTMLGNIINLKLVVVKENI